MVCFVFYDVRAMPPHREVRIIPLRALGNRKSHSAWSKRREQKSCTGFGWTSGRSCSPTSPCNFVIESPDNMLGGKQRAYPEMGLVLRGDKRQTAAHHLRLRRGGPPQRRSNTAFLVGGGKGDRRGSRNASSAAV